ncbi:MAG TPA: hypothetical protein V6D18_09435 [Thermosynechococcaceae cyanobacterium]
MSTVDKSSPKPLLSVQAIVLAGIIWAVLALLFFLLFSVPPQGKSHPLWYSLGTLVFEEVAYFSAAVLCLRNWRSPQIVSGRNVWLGIGLGMLSYFLGNLIFGYWELGLRREPDISPADFFFILTYIFLGIGMSSAVFSRKLSLEIWQWGCVVLITAVGIAIAAWVALPSPPGTATNLLLPPAYAQSAPANPSKPAPSKPAPQKPTPTVGNPPQNSQNAEAAKAEQTAQAPEWAVSMENLLRPLKDPVNLFYLLCDLFLLVLATMLLLAFWGGRFSQSWRMIAAAAFCLYIADTWFKYATRDPNYQTGSLPEVFWVFTGVLFGIGAVLEYDVSSRARSRSGSRRRTA